MAKKNTLNVTGLSISDILSLTAEDLDKYTTAEIKKINTRLNSAINKKIARAGSLKGSVHPNLKYLHEKGLRRSVKGIKNKTEAKFALLESERTYLETKVTKKGSAEFLLKQELRLGGGFANDDEANLFWETYKKYMETDAGKRLIARGKNTAEAQKYIYKRHIKDGEYKEDVSERGTFSGLTQRLNRLNRELEEERQARENVYEEEQGNFQRINFFDEIEEI